MPPGLGVLGLLVVEVVLAAEVALPHAVVLIAGAVVLDAVTVGGLRHHKGVSIYDVRTKGGRPGAGGGYPKRRCSKGGCMNFTVDQSQMQTRGGGGQKISKFCERHI